MATVDCTDADAAVLCKQFSIKGYPSLIFLREGMMYRYNKARKLDEFHAYVASGYRDAPVDKVTEIPKRLEGMESAVHETKEVFGEIAAALDRGFEKIGLGIVPSWLRYVLVLTVVCSPLFGVCYILLFDETDTELEEARKRLAARDAKVR